MKPGLRFTLLVSALALALALALGACQSVPQATRSEPATFGDAVHVNAADPLRLALGAGVGAYLNRRLDRELGSHNLALHDAAAVQALWHNTKGYGAAWRNPDTGASGTIVPSSRVEQTGSGLCRHFHDKVQLPDEALFGIDGTACLNGDVWTVDF